LWENSWHYDIVGDRRQSLLLAIKEAQSQFYRNYSCFPSTPSYVKVSAFTDLYTDPVFISYIDHQVSN